MTVVIVGAGHNGLVAGFYLARAGVPVTIVERTDTVGGACRTEELIPGYLFSTCANVFAWMRPKVAADMHILENGVEICGGGFSARVLDGNRPFVWWPDADRLTRQIAALSKYDAAAWDVWIAFWRGAAELLGPYLLSYPPSLPDLVARARRDDLEDVLGTLFTTSLSELVDRFFRSPEMRGCFGPPTRRRQLGGTMVQR